MNRKFRPTVPVVRNFKCPVLEFYQRVGQRRSAISKGKFPKQSVFPDTLRSLLHGVQNQLFAAQIPSPFHGHEPPEFAGQPASLQLMSRLPG